MSKHYKSEYYVRADGAHIMSHDMFKQMDHAAICKLLGIKRV